MPSAGEDTGTGSQHVRNAAGWNRRQFAPGFVIASTLYSTEYRDFVR
jgi:hypothetical protein